MNNTHTKRERNCVKERGINGKERRPIIRLYDDAGHTPWLRSFISDALLFSTAVSHQKKKRIGKEEEKEKKRENPNNKTERRPYKLCGRRRLRETRGDGSAEGVILFYFQRTKLAARCVLGYADGRTERRLRPTALLWNPSSGGGSLHRVRSSVQYPH